jgi:O-antigen biosynthesis protein
MISVITPTHDEKYLSQAYASLQRQTLHDWEWVLVTNRGVNATFDDPRVRVINVPYDLDRIGALKRFACQSSRGDIYLELDHDDILMPTCLEKVQDAFDADPELTMVYSNDAKINDDLSPADCYSARYGWKYHRFTHDGQTFMECISPSLVPQHFARIWYAPDHVRAWKADAYWKIGGHDASMRVADDHDLTIRNYLHGKITHIPECLYLYRVHEKNSVKTYNREIQEAMWGNYRKYIQSLLLCWAKNKGLLAVDLCSGKSRPAGYVTCDRAAGAADITCDLNDRWPFEDNSVGVLRAQDAVEHLRNPVHTINEAWRCLSHGGVILIEVPSTDGRGAFCDPTHVSFWNELSFRYYTNKHYRAYVEPEAKCRFQTMCIETHFPDDWHRANNVPYVRAHLIALKNDQRFHGEYHW